MAKMQLGIQRDVRVAVTKMIKTDDGRGRRSVANGFLVGDLRIIVDTDALIRAIGEKALRSKGKRSQLQGGAVIVEAFDVKHIGAA